MVKCVCGKPIEKVPTWLESVNVTFVCTNCPTRQVKPISQVQLLGPEVAAPLENEAIEKEFKEEEG